MDTEVKGSANNSTDISTESIAQKRQLSRKLVAMLIAECNYQSAAEIIGGAEGGFRLYVHQIDEVIIWTRKAPGSVSFAAQLQPLLDTARAEIAYHKQWLEGILSTLPSNSDTDPIRQTCQKTNTAAGALRMAVMLAPDRYLEAQAHAFDR